MNTIDLHNYEAFLLDCSEGNLAAEDIVLLKAFVVEHPELEIDLDDFDLPYIPAENHAADFKNALKRTETGLTDEELLNYLEGNLSAEECFLFELKLEKDEVLANELELYRKTILAADIDSAFNFKVALKKTEEDLVLNNRLILYVENQLTPTEKIEFEKELGLNSTLQNELQLVSKTILVADESLIYSDKAALKKENKVIALFSLRTVRTLAAAILLLLGLSFIYRYYNSKEEVKGGLADHNKTKLNNTTSIINPTVILQPQQKLPVNTSSPEKKLAKNIVNRDLESDTEKEKIEKTPVSFQSKTLALNLYKDTASPGNPIRVSRQSIVDITREKQQPALINTNEVEKIIVPQKQEQPEVVATVSKKENNVDSIVNRQSYLLFSDDLDGGEDVAGTKDENKKSGLWKRAVQLAKQANKLGVKSVDGQENSENKYRLSFNSFSVEKK